MSALVINLFLFTYLYFNLGTPKVVLGSNMTAAASGNWTSTSTWSAGRLPQDGDTLTIPAGQTVTVDIVTPSYNHLLIIVNGILYFNGGKKIIMCEGMVVVNTGGLLSASNSGSKFEICGSFLWDGASPGAGPLVFGGFTTTLPVDLVYFKAAPDNQKVNLNWQTASEVNSDYFIVERSDDGTNFSTLTTVRGKGNSTINTTYNYSDNEPLQGISYYRLKQFDFDGTSHTFNAVTVSMETVTDIKVYPNPVPAGNTATIEIPHSDNQIEVSMVNIEGKKIFSRVFEKNTSRGPIWFQTEALAVKGTFLLIVSGAENKIVKKIIVV